MRLLWRLAFSAWGVLWLLLTTVVISSITVILGLLGVRQDHLQALARLWARMLLWGLRLKVTVNGRANLESGATYIFAANHSSMLDIILLLAELPRNFRWMAKKNLFNIPFLGWGMHFCGYIPVDRENRRAAMRSIGVACQRIEEGVSVVIFPEGTRTPEGQLHHFQPGGFVLAIRTGRPVVPLAIVGAGAALPRGSLYFQPGHLSLNIAEPISTEGLSQSDRHELAQRTEDQVRGMLGLPRDQVDKQSAAT